MKMVSCADLSELNCGFVAKGATDDEVKQKLMTHGMSAHADKVAKAMPVDRAKMEAQLAKILAKQKQV